MDEFDKKNPEAFRWTERHRFRLRGQFGQVKALDRG
jgi:hypothetical protein